MPSYYCFIFTYVCSFMLVMSSEDWFLVWMGLEINMMSFLMLVYCRDNMSVIESCFKYFFIQSIGSAFFVGMFYVNQYFMGGIFFLILSYKIGAGPFFFWFPSLCSGLSWGSCYLLMTFQKILPLMLIYMFIHWILWMMVILSLLMGVLGSFNQSNMKQLMAYSSVHHLGWIMMIMMVNVGWFMYLVMYMIVLFSVVGLLLSEEIIEFSVMYCNKFKLIFIVGMLSMAGIPPLLGFYLKWMALINIFYINFIYSMMLVLVSVIMLYVYLQIVYDVMFKEVNGIIISMDFKGYMYNMEILSVMGIVFGIVMGMYMMMY